MRRIVELLLLFAILFATIGYVNAVQAPLVRELRMPMDDWPPDAPPLRVVLLSDLHVIAPDNPPRRLSAIVDKVNRLQPDLVLIAGDLLSYRALATRHYAPDEAVAPLRGLRARLGVVAVMGNHDYERQGQTRLPPALAAAGVTLLRNQAVRRGPLTIAGTDDFNPGKLNIAKMDAAARMLPGPTLVLTHSPDPIPDLPPRYRLVLAGHTHCGQIALPIVGRLATASRHGERYACGVIREGARTILVSAGIGNSVLPLRYGAHPDLWVVTLGPR